MGQANFRRVCSLVRLFAMPPAVCALLIIFNHNH